MNIHNDRELIDEVRSSFDIRPRQEFANALKKKLLDAQEKRNGRAHMASVVKKWTISAAAVLVLAGGALIWKQGTNITAALPFLHSILLKDKDTQVTEVVGIAAQTVEKLYKEFPEMRGSEQLIFLETSKESQRREYYIEFRKRENDNVILYRDVSIDSQNGLLLSYSDNLLDEDDKNVATPKEASVKKATTFLQDFLGQSFEEYRIDSVNVDKKGTRIRYVRFVNNLPVKGMDYRVYLTGDGKMVRIGSGEVAGLLTEKPIFPNPSIGLDKSIIERNFAAYMKLQYKKREGQNEFSLLYEDDSIGYFNALTGEEIKVTDHSPYRKNYSPTIQVNPGGKQVKIKSAQEVPDALAQFGIDCKGAVFKVQPHYSYMPKEMAGYETKWKNKKMIVITMDGIVSEFIISKPTEETGGTKLSDQELEQRALAYLQQYMTKGITEVKRYITRGNSKEDKEQNMKFVFTYKGVVVPSHRYDLTIDKTTGEILSISLEMVKENFTKNWPDPTNAISPAEAAAIYLKHRPLTLTYVYPVKDGNMQQTPILAYTPIPNNRGSGSIDAITGKFEE